MGNIFFDISNTNFTIGTPPVCGDPAGLTTTAISASGATVNWSSVASALSYDVQYKPASSSTWSSKMCIRDRSSATNRIFKVYVIKKKVSVNLSSEGNKSVLQMQVFPNPNDGSFVLKFNLQMPSDAKLSIYDLNGQILETTILKNRNAGDVYKRQALYQRPAIWQYG